MNNLIHEGDRVRLAGGATGKVVRVYRTSYPRLCIVQLDQRLSNGEGVSVEEASDLEKVNQ